jgi:hypothetical protein
MVLCLLVFFSISCQEIVNEPAPTYALKQNYPNPFTDSTVVLYGIPSVTQNSFGPWIRVVVNDRFNRTYATLVENHSHPAGHDFKVIWNGRGSNFEKAPPGIYYIELQQLNMSNSNGVYVHDRKVALKQ